MKTYIFHSPVAARLQAFLDMRRAYGWKAVALPKKLQYIDKFLATVLKPGQTITHEIVNRWFKSIEGLAVNTRAARITVFRQFCRYLKNFEQGTFQIPYGLSPKQTRPIPYIYTKGQIRTILASIKRIGPKGSFRPVVISTLIGLLYNAGLRISEGLKLTLGDIDLKRRLLLVRQTKFKKSRLVPLSISTVRVLRSYLGRRRAAGFSTNKSSPVFIHPTHDGNGKSYEQCFIRQIFRRITRKKKIRGLAGRWEPRIHDLRHSFAVHRLAKWYREGATISSKLPLLSTYLGHSSLTGTEVYLRATAELLSEANKRFWNHCALPCVTGTRKEAAHVH